MLGVGGGAERNEDVRLDVLPRVRQARGRGCRGGHRGPSGVVFCCMSEQIARCALRSF